MHSFWWLSSIPLYICTTVSLFINLLMGIGLLPCPRYCKLCSKQHEDTCVFSIMVSSGYCPIVGLLDHLVVLSLVFFKVLSSIVAGSIYIPTNSARRFPLLHILSSTYCLYTFWWLPFLPFCVRWYLIVVLICIFLLMSNVELFLCIFSHQYVFFGEMSV